MAVANPVFFLTTSAALKKAPVASPSKNAVPHPPASNQIDGSKGGGFWSRTKAPSQLPGKLVGSSAQLSQRPQSQGEGNTEQLEPWGEEEESLKREIMSSKNVHQNVKKADSKKDLPEQPAEEVEARAPVTTKSQEVSGMSREGLGSREGKKREEQPMQNQLLVAPAGSGLKKSKYNFPPSGVLRHSSPPKPPAPVVPDTTLSIGENEVTNLTKKRSGYTRKVSRKDPTTIDLVHACPPSFPKPHRLGTTPRANMALTVGSAEAALSMEEVERGVKRLLGASEGEKREGEGEGAAVDTGSAWKMALGLSKQKVRSIEIQAGGEIDCFVDVNPKKKSHGWGRKARDHSPSNLPGMGMGLARGGTAMTSAQLAAYVNYNAISEILRGGAKRLPIKRSEAGIQSLGGSFPPGGSMRHPAGTMEGVEPPTPTPRKGTAGDASTRDGGQTAQSKTYSRSETLEDLSVEKGGRRTGGELYSSFGPPSGAAFPRPSPRTKTAQTPRKNQIGKSPRTMMAQVRPATHSGPPSKTPRPWETTTPPLGPVELIGKSQRLTFTGSTSMNGFEKDRLGSGGGTRQPTGGSLNKGFTPEARSRHAENAAETRTEFPDTKPQRPKTANVAWSASVSEYSSRRGDDDALGPDIYFERERMYIPPGTASTVQSFGDLPTRYEHRAVLSEDDPIISSAKSPLNPVDHVKSAVKEKAPVTYEQKRLENLQEQKVANITHMKNATASPDLYYMGIRSPKDFVPLGDEPLPSMTELWSPKTNLFMTAKPQSAAQSVSTRGGLGSPNAPRPASHPAAGGQGTPGGVSVVQPAEGGSVGGTVENGEMEIDHHAQALVAAEKQMQTLQSALDSAWVALKESSEERDLLALHIALTEGKTNVVQERTQKKVQAQSIENKTGVKFSFEEIENVRLDATMAWGAAGAYNETKGHLRATETVKKTVGNCTIQDLRRDRDNLDRLLTSAEALETEMKTRKLEMEVDLVELLTKRDKIEKENRILEKQKRQMKRLMDELRAERAATAKVQGNEVSINALMNELKTLTLENNDLRKQLGGSGHNIDRGGESATSSLFDDGTSVSSNTHSPKAGDVPASLGELIAQNEIWLHRGRTRPGSKHVPVNLEEELPPPPWVGDEEPKPNPSTPPSVTAESQEKTDFPSVPVFEGIKEEV